MLQENARGTNDRVSKCFVHFENNMLPRPNFANLVSYP